MLDVAKLATADNLQGASLNLLNMFLNSSYREKCHQILWTAA